MFVEHCWASGRDRKTLCYTNSKQGDFGQEERQEHWRGTIVERKSKTVCCLPNSVSWFVADVQEGWSVFLDCWGSGLIQSKDFFKATFWITNYHEFSNFKSLLFWVGYIGLGHKVEARRKTIYFSCPRFLCCFRWYSQWESAWKIQSRGSSDRSSLFLRVPDCDGKCPLWNVFIAHWYLH